MAKAGAFAPDSDTIAIPLYWFVAAELLTAPLTWGVVWLCARRYPGSVSLAAWNAARPLWSWIWTAFLLAGVVAFAAAIAYEQLWQPVFVLHCVADIYFLLIVRSGLVAQGEGSRSSAAMKFDPHRSGA